MLRLLALLLLVLPAAAAPDVVFDGARAHGGAAAVAGSWKPARPALVKVSANSAVEDAAPAPAAPTHTITGSGWLGPYGEDEFELTTGRTCLVCKAPQEGKWYFMDEVIATPKSGRAALIWIGSKEMYEGVKISADGKLATLKDGTIVPFDVVKKIDSNTSFYDASSVNYFSGRSVRVRGELIEKDGVKTLVARTIWPEDWRVDTAHMKEGDAKNASDIDALVAADKGGAKAPFETTLLWKREGVSGSFDGKPVMGFMLNGAQGDDDEALAGHSSLFTGRMGPGGSMADWLFDNFYDMNTYSEKGIVAAMTPMDKYMADLNSGQSWYRPSYVLVMVMKSDRAPKLFQETFKEQYAKYYSQAIKYDRTEKNCTALISDPVREQGWKFPENGKTPKPVAWLIAKAVGLASDKEAGEQIRRSLRAEPTRHFPRAQFSTVGGDLLTMAGAWGAEPRSREYTPLEKDIRDDLEAVLFVRLPQLPSSREFGRDPAGGVVDYFTRTPMDRSKWKTHPMPARPFPPPK